MNPEEAAAAVCRFRRFSHDLGDVSKVMSAEGVPQMEHHCLMGKRIELGGAFFGLVLFLIAVSWDELLVSLQKNNIFFNLQK